MEIKTSIHSLYYNKLELLLYIQVPLNNNNSVFELKKVPNIPICDYIHKIFVDWDIEVNTLIYSYILLNDFIEKSKIILNEKNIYLIYLASLLTSCKMLQDEIYSQYDFSKVAGIPLKRLNEIEAEFLEAIDFKVHITDEQFRQTYKSHFSHAI